MTNWVSLAGNGFKVFIGILFYLGILLIESCNAKLKKAKHDEVFLVG